MIDDGRSRIHAAETDTLQVSLRRHTEPGHLVHVYLNRESRLSCLLIESLEGTIETDRCVPKYHISTIC